MEAIPTSLLVFCYFAAGLVYAVISIAFHSEIMWNAACVHARPANYGPRAIMTAAVVYFLLIRTTLWPLGILRWLTRRLPV